MKIALFQMTMGMNMAENLKKCLSALQDAAQCGADLILYPELTLLPFFPQYEKQNVSDKAVRSNANEVLSFQKACRENRICRKRGIRALKVVYSTEKSIRPLDDMEINCRTHCICPPLEQNVNVRSEEIFQEVLRSFHLSPV